MAQEQPVLVFASVLLGLALLAPRSFGQGDNVRLLGHLDQHGWYNDVWGYHSPTGIELAIVGTDVGTAFVNATDPRNPVELKLISGPNSIWRDMDTWDNYAYAVTEGGGGMQIIDLSDPLNPTLVKTWGKALFSHAHTMYIDKTKGNAYINGTDAGMVIASLADPVNPSLITTYTTDYVHDVFVQDGLAHTALIYAGKYRILDVSNLPTIKTLDTESTPGNFTHSTWATTDNKYCATTDENSTGHIAIWDIRDPTNIQKISEYKSSARSIVHNPYIKGQVLYCSWYTDGFVAVDISDPANPKKLGQYDTYPGPSGSEDGMWSCYPFQPSGVVYGSDMQTGLYIMQIKCFPPVSYGSGLAGSGGFVPIQTAQGGFPSIGNGAFQVAATNLLGGSAGLFIIGFGQASIPFHGGTLLVDLTKPFLLKAFTAQGSGPGSGSFTLLLPIVNDSSLVNLQVDMQVFQADPGAIQGLSMSAGLEFVICDPN